MAIAKYSYKFIGIVILDAAHIARIQYGKFANKCTATTSTDMLDEFTDKLIEEKATKWRKRNDLAEKKYKPLIDMEQTLTQITERHVEDLDSSLVNAIRSEQCENAIALLKTHQKMKEYPSSKVLSEAAAFFGRSGNKKGIQMTQEICDRFYKDEFNNQAQYRHYIAEASWKNGNIEEALNIFLEVYRNHNALRRKIRNMTKFLFSNCILYKSEASIVLITRFAHTLAEEYGDLVFLSNLWQYCFCSEWYSDNQLAAELLRNNEMLRDIFKKRALFLALEALRAHQVEVVQKLLEVCLLYNMKLQYAQVLRALFDYKCYQGDVKACASIIESALELNISLNIEEHEAFLYLLANNRERLKLKELAILRKRHKIDVPTFIFKF